MKISSCQILLSLTRQSEPPPAVVFLRGTHVVASVLPCARFEAPRPNASPCEPSVEERPAGSCPNQAKGASPGPEPMKLLRRTVASTEVVPLKLRSMVVWLAAESHAPPCCGVPDSYPCSDLLQGCSA
jgi:hypothetical protein